MNTVTFETAKALRDAGFPQPEPAPGQFWYAPSGEISYVDYVGEPDFGDGIWVLLNGDVKEAANFIQNAVFAPQAHDILALDDSLKFWYSNIEKAFVCKIWVVEDSRLTGRIITDENPHEAAAHGFMGNEYEKWVKAKAEK